ncbi:MAG: BatA domain-containing protein [Bacteroidales bacterium]|nr:BatA domain-containing protein [Bacteroidales bacterium]
MIAFKHPEFLYFLLTIAIPIIIHLFSFRKYKKVYFHNLQFIKNIQIEQNSTKSKLKEILILCSRIGMILFLVLTFAQPYIPLKNTQISQKQNYAAIYIDNSFSSQSETTYGIALEHEKTKALEIVDAYSSETKFFLFTNSSSPTEKVELTKDEIKNEISLIQVSPNQLLVSDIYKRAAFCAKKTSNPLQLHILSDLQKTTFNLQEIEDDSLVTTNIYPIINQQQNNISIDSCFFESKHHSNNQTEKITATISNHSDENFTNIPVKLFIDDTLKAIATTTLKPNAKSSVPIEFNTHKSGIISGRIEIEDFPILYDNTYYFSYFIEDKISILDIFENTPNKNIAALIKNQKEFSIEYQDIKNIDYSSLANFSIILLDNLTTIPSGLSNELNKLKFIGKTIICAPSESIDIESYNKFLAIFGKEQITQKDSTKTEITNVDEKNTIFKNVFEKKQQNNKYPEVFSHYKIVPQKNNVLISLQNNDAFVIQESSGNNTLFLFTSPLNSKAGTFISSPLFVGLYNMFLCASHSNELQTTLGQSSEIYISKKLSEEALHIENQAKNIDIIPQYRTDIQTAKTIINPMQQITEAGNYIITQSKNAIAGISYNYDRKESTLDFYTTDELKEQANHLSFCDIVTSEKNIAENIKELNEGKALWKCTLWITIFFVLLEVFLIISYDRITNTLKTKKEII